MDIFGESGTLPNAPLDGSTPGQAGALALKVSLAPGETREITFVLAWDFPVVQFKNPVEGTRWLKRYKEWYPGDFQGWDIARDTVCAADEIEAKIDAWWQPIVTDPVYPDWLKQGALYSFRIT